MKLISYYGLEYQCCDRSFLNESQANYALKQLWRLIAGVADWEGAPALKFRAIEINEIHTMFALPPGLLEWTDLVKVLPEQKILKLDTHKLPALCNTDLSVIYDGEKKYFPLDLVAATFILLTRWEEWARPDLDQFGCHKEESTIAVKQGFVARPVLDEWALVLRAWLKKSNPVWTERIHPFQIELSHDIDIFRYYNSPARVLKRFAKLLLKQRQLLNSFQSILEGTVSIFSPISDPCINALNTLMHYSESYVTKSTFFFMAAEKGQYDEGYKVSSNLFKKVFHRIIERGHQVGWHPSFRAAENNIIFSNEQNRFNQATGLNHYGVRQHFLKWRACDSWQRYARSGIVYDASMGYNYRLGFRASTARYFEAFDLENNKPMKLEVRPLIIMDGPLMRSEHSIKENIMMFKNRCYAVNGCLSILIHNYSVMMEPLLLDSISSGLETI
jgi:hypothetical protein